MCQLTSASQQKQQVNTSTTIPTNSAKATTSEAAVDINALLEDQVQRLILKSKESNDNDPVLKVASLPKLYDGVVRAGTPIYVSRSRIPVICCSALAVTAVAWSVYETNLVACVCCMLAALVSYDLLSGCLHIVFDNPENLAIPVLSQPCLEFQMHHHFPTDLVQRKFLDVLGDLNTVVGVLFIWNIFVLDLLSNPIARYMVFLKLLMSYYGQFSHRSAHTPSSVKNPVITGLRSLGFMIPLDKHRSHHRHPHDKDFCLVGVCNPFCNFLFHNVSQNRWFWLVSFLALGLGGAVAECIIMEKLLTCAGVV